MRGSSAICNLSGLLRSFERGRLKLSCQRDHNLLLELSAQLRWDLAVTVEADGGLHRGKCGQKRRIHLVQHFTTREASSLCIATLTPLIQRKPAVVLSALERISKHCCRYFFPMWMQWQWKEGLPTACWTFAKLTQTRQMESVPNEERLK